MPDHIKIRDLLNAKIDNVKLTQDADGNIRAEWTDEQLTSINSWLKSELDAAYDDFTPLWSAAVENVETYRTIKVPIPDTNAKSIYPAPIARIPADQRIAGVHNSVMRPRPVFSIDPYLDSTYPMPAGTQLGPGIPTGPVPVEAMNAEQAAHDLETCYDFVMRERVQLSEKLLKGVRGAVCGAPFWWKVVADPEQHASINPTMLKTLNGAVVDFNDKYSESRQRGDIVKWYLVPFTNCMMPIEMLYEDGGIDRAPWFAERSPLRPDELILRYKTGKLFLIKDDAEAEALAQDQVERTDQFRAQIASETENRTATTPIKICDTWTAWYDKLVTYVDPLQPTDQDGKELKRTKLLRFLGLFHRTSGKLLDSFLNPYEHQCRPFELVDEMEDGDCTVARLKYHQQMFTYAAQSEITSAHIANLLLFWYDPNIPDVSAHFTKNKVITHGDHIPGIKDKEWGTAAAGEKHFSMIELMKLILNMSQLDSRENDFTMGGRPPGRTSAETVDTVYQHAAETRTMFIHRLSNKLSRLLRLDMETRRQFQPLGETLPLWNDKSKARISTVFRFPVGDVMDNFRIALTVSDDLLAAEHDPQQIMLRKQALMQDGEYVAKIIAAIVNLQAPLPPEGVELFAKIANRDQAMLRELMGQMVTDEEDYDLTKQIRALINARNSALAAQQQQAAEQSQQPQMMQPPNGMPPQAPAGGAVGGQNAPPSGPPNATQPQPPHPPAAPVPTGAGSQPPGPAQGQPTVPAPAGAPPRPAA